MAGARNEIREHSSGDGRFDPDEFGRRDRQFAIDARWILGRPDSPIHEVR